MVVGGAGDLVLVSHGLNQTNTRLRLPGLRWLQEDRDIRAQVLKRRKCPRGR